MINRENSNVSMKITKHSSSTQSFDIRSIINIIVQYCVTDVFVVAENTRLQHHIYNSQCVNFSHTCCKFLHMYLAKTYLQKNIIIRTYVIQRYISPILNMLMVSVFLLTSQLLHTRETRPGIRD